MPCCTRRHPHLAQEAWPGWQSSETVPAGGARDPRTGWPCGRSCLPPRVPGRLPAVHSHCLGRRQRRAVACHTQPRGRRRAQGDCGPATCLCELAKGYNDILLSAEGLGTVPYRIVGTYVLPWAQVEPSPPEEEEVSIEVRYDRTEVAVGETITATVDVMLNRPGVARLAVLELGLPPGLEIVERQWDELVERGIIARYQRDGERMIVHLADLPAEEPVRFSYHLQAQLPAFGADAAHARL